MLHLETRLWIDLKNMPRRGWGDQSELHFNEGSFRVSQIAPEKLTSGLKYLYAWMLMDAISITLPKFSVLCFYARFFKTSSVTFRISLQLIGSIVAAWISLL